MSQTVEVKPSETIMSVMAIEEACKALGLEATKQGADLRIQIPGSWIFRVCRTSEGYVLRGDNMLFGEEDTPIGKNGEILIQQARYFEAVDDLRDQGFSELSQSVNEKGDLVVQLLPPL